MVVPPPNKVGSFISSTVESGVRWITDSMIFAGEFFKNPTTLGTPFVCSPFVATQLLCHISDLGKGSKNYLEVGAGTGAMTEHLIRKLKPEDRLCLVEVEPKLCEVLRAKFKDYANVQVLEKGIQDCSELKDHSFDVIISTVPFNSLPSSSVLSTILAAYERLVKPNGIVSHVEYVGTSTASTWIRLGESRRAYVELQKVKNDFFNKYLLSRHIVLANIPPARVTHCKI